MRLRHAGAALAALAFLVAILLTASIASPPASRGQEGPAHSAVVPGLAREVAPVTPTAIPPELLGWQVSAVTSADGAAVCAPMGEPCDGDCASWRDDAGLPVPRFAGEDGEARLFGRVDFPVALDGFFEPGRVLVVVTAEDGGEPLAHIRAEAWPLALADGAPGGPAGTVPFAFDLPLPGKVAGADSLDAVVCAIDTGEARPSGAGSGLSVEVTDEGTLHISGSATEPAAHLRIFPFASDAGAARGFLGGALADDDGLLAEGDPMDLEVFLPPPGEEPPIINHLAFEGVLGPPLPPEPSVDVLDVVDQGDHGELTFAITTPELVEDIEVLFHFEGEGSQPFTLPGVYFPGGTHYGSVELPGGFLPAVADVSIEAEDWSVLGEAPPMGRVVAGPPALVTDAESGEVTMYVELYNSTDGSVGLDGSTWSAACGTPEQPFAGYFNATPTGTLGSGEFTRFPLAPGALAEVEFGLQEPAAAVLADPGALQDMDAFPVCEPPSGAVR